MTIENTIHWKGKPGWTSYYDLSRIDASISPREHNASFESIERIAGTCVAMHHYPRSQAPAAQRIGASLR